MLHQAVAYQVEFARYHPQEGACHLGLLHDYTGFIVPNAVAHTMRGHRKNVKSVRFVGEEGARSSVAVATIRCGCGMPTRAVRGRVAGASQPRVGCRLYTHGWPRCVGIGRFDGQGVGCGEWAVPHDAACRRGRCVQLSLPPRRAPHCFGGLRQARAHVRRRDRLDRQDVYGHQLGVSSAIFNPLGNLIVTASKDTTIRFWDVVSGLCIRTITGHLGEVTSVEINETGSLLLSSSKDNSNRLWDLRMLRPLKRFKGHQNTSKNFIRSASRIYSLLVGGSEDGLIYMWDQESSEVLQTLEGHGRDTLHAPARAGLGGHTASGAATATSVVSDLTSLSTNNNVAYGAVWNKAQSLLASCRRWNGQDVDLGRRQGSRGQCRPCQTFQR